MAGSWVDEASAPAGLEDGETPPPLLEPLLDNQRVSTPSPVTIGRYEVRRELGRGMMGIVYEAHDPVLQRSLALKVIQAAHGVTEQERRSYEERFFAEARAAAGLTHPGIIVVHDVGRDPASGVLFLALELLQGRPLDSVLRERGRLEWRQAVDVARKVAEALHHAHLRGVVHRDVKPANVMLPESGEPKIMDFGIAKIEASQLTATGQFLGTPLYMSPEQALAHPVDARSDIFALGAVLYEMLTGRAAFEGESVTMILLNIVSREPEPPTLLAPNLPGGLDYLIARSLAKDRSDRYPDARSLALDLEDILAGRPPRGQREWRAPGGSGTLAGPDARRASDLVKAAAAQATSVASASDRSPAPARAAGAGPAEIAAKAVPVRPAARRRPATAGGPWLRYAVAAIVLALASGVAYLKLRPEPVARRIALPTPVTTTPPPPTTPAPPAEPATASTATEAVSPPPAPQTRSSRPPATAAPAPAPTVSRVLLKLEHPLRAGVLRVWVDDDQVIERKFTGQVTKGFAGIKLRKGRVSEALEVKPGRREVKVQVGWDDKSQVDSVTINLKPGETYHVDATLGSLGGIRKDLSLRWY